jgi:hypothetical protein
LLRRVSDDYGPFTDLPALDEAVADVWIAAHESLGDGGVGAAKDEESAIHGVDKSTREDEFAARVEFTSKFQVFVAISGALFDVTVNEFLVKESEVEHRTASWMNEAKISPQSA